MMYNTCVRLQKRVRKRKRKRRLLVAAARINDTKKGEEIRKKKMNTDTGAVIDHTRKLGNTREDQNQYVN